MYLATSIHLVITCIDEFLVALVCLFVCPFIYPDDKSNSNRSSWLQEMFRGPIDFGDDWDTRLSQLT